MIGFSKTDIKIKNSILRNNTISSYSDAMSISGGFIAAASFTISFENSNSTDNQISSYSNDKFSISGGFLGF